MQATGHNTQGQELEKNLNKIAECKKYFILLKNGLNEVRATSLQKGKSPLTDLILT